ncbi:sugar phosphate permease [Mesocricetibacter intestinalis]|uniref:Sugar phosphate permease n=1 Tax=Mesocricetibacter intestinalis TaxID=1521930 RepID=A0A4R6V6Q5_9PAST|nr:MFS transporter [Mesocricetibacter intestinalis]TDQ56817.1 sugar phosphate permease [Mesocricetibacter intestinalis]
MGNVEKTEKGLNFGKQGWFVIINQAVMFWVAAGVCTHGLNVILPAISEFYQLDYNELLFFVTPASWAAIPAAPFCAWLCEKKGNKFVINLCLILCALCFGLIGYADSVLIFTLLFAGVSFFGTGFAYIAGTALVADWFVRKQSMALGFITFGQTTSSAFFVPVLSVTFSLWGVHHGFWGMSLLMLLIALFVWKFIANKPEDVGLLPDNEPLPPTTGTASAPQPEYIGLTRKKLLAMKDVWFMGLSTGAIYIMLVGVVSQIVPRLVHVGLDLNTAIFYMSASALFGTLGAYAWGWLNHKIGIKPALLIYNLWWMLAILLNLSSSSTVLLVSMGMIGLALPGATNYSTAFVATKFPRQAYVRALGIIHPIQSVVRCCAFSILAFGLSYLGGYDGAYLLLVGVGVISFILIWATDLTPVNSNNQSE